MGSTSANKKRTRHSRNSIVAQLFLRAWFLFCLNEKTPPSTDRRRLAETAAAFRSSEARKFSALALNSGGNTTKATLPTRRAADSLRHDRFLLRSTGRLRRGENRADSAEAPSPRNYFPALGLRSARAGEYGYVNFCGDSPEAAARSNFPR